MMGGIKIICFLALMLCVSLSGRGETPRRVLVVHSYEDSYAGYPKFNRMIQEAFERKKMNAECRVLYLDCESYREREELERMYFMLDSLAEWKPEIILVNEDQATYSLLKCAHPLVETTPVVFGGVNYPNWDLIKQYPNVTGFHDKIDFRKNIEMARTLFGENVRFFTILDSTFLDRKIRTDLFEQLQNDPLYWHEQPRPFFEKLQKKEQKNVISIRYISVRNSRTADLIWNLSKFHRERCYFQFKRDFTTINVSNLNSGPSITAINDGFGFNERLVGGYMTSLETQVEEEVDAAVRILKGINIRTIPIKESHKDYVLNWNVMEQIGLKKEKVPASYIILNMPFNEKFHTLWVVIVVFVTLMVITIMTWLTYLYRREAKRKRKAQNDLADKKETLELAIEGGSTFAWKLEKDYFIFETAFWESLKIPVRGLTVEDLKSLSHPDYRELIQADWDQLLTAKNKTVQLQCDFNGKGYQWWEFRYTTTLLANGNYRTAGLLLNIQSVKDKEAELEESRRLAEKAELKESFLTNMSHEIRTPLNAIVGFTEIVTSDEELSREEKKEYVNIIQMNTQLLLKLINDILEISRLDSGHMSFEYSVCKVDELIHDAYQTHQVLVPSPLEFLKDVPPGLSLQVKVDKNRMMQVLTNFINNACKFTSQGYIKIGYVYAFKSGEVHIYVEDTGKGIPLEEQKIIFNRFYKRDEFTQGTGLGLAISQKIIKQMGGRIELQSEVGKGSRFTIVLPCCKVDFH